MTEAAYLIVTFNYYCFSELSLGILFFLSGREPCEGIYCVC